MRSTLSSITLHFLHLGLETANLKNQNWPIYIKPVRYKLKKVTHLGLEPRTY